MIDIFEVRGYFGGDMFSVALFTDKAEAEKCLTLMKEKALNNPFYKPDYRVINRVVFETLTQSQEYRINSPD